VKAFLIFLPVIVPLATRWVSHHEAVILKNGDPLTTDQQADALRVGVRDVQKIRLMIVDEIPLPTHPILIWLGRRTGLLSRGVAGITLGYGVYIQRGLEGNRSLWTHEFVHVAQYERLGSIPAFLKAYLTECLEKGYPHGPLEQEAIEKSR
jgi:hypothetical protein